MCTVQIAGVALAVGGTAVVGVELAGVPVLEIVSRTSKYIEVTARGHVVTEDTVGSVVLTADNGQRVGFDGFTYNVAVLSTGWLPINGQQGTILRHLLVSHYETTKGTAPTDLRLAVTFTANQASYKDFERALNDAVTSGGMLAAFKRGGKAYQHIQEIAISTNVLYTGLMC